MSTYDLLTEYRSKNNSNDPSDYVAVNPFWVLAVVRFDQPLTFSRTNLFNGSTTPSFNNDSGLITKTRPTLIIANECLNLHVQTSKDSHIASMSAMLIDGGINFLSEILPADWVCAWIVNDVEKARDLVSRIQQQDACNRFDDGLKFVGRVQSVRKMIHQDGNGPRTVRYQLVAAAGKELDSSVFYDQHLGEQEPSIGQYMAKLNVGISEIFNLASTRAQQGKGGIDSNLAIPKIFQLLLGSGIPPRAASPSSSLQIATGLTNTAEAPYAYAVPAEIGKFLARDEPSKSSGVLSYADIVEMLIGLQKFSNPNARDVAVFVPDGVQLKSPPLPAGTQGPVDNTTIRPTSYPLKGEFLPVPIPLTNQPVWSIMEQFLNGAINEMFFTLRANPEGFVVPTIVIRQLPFSTPQGVTALGSDVTGFLELPRWSCPPVLIRDLDIGRSDATHFNFIHVYGQASTNQSGQTLTQQIIRNPPIRDEQDIKRNGIRPYMQTVACSVDDTLAGPKKWMGIISDFLIGQQFTLNGTVVLQGIQAPICPGDNIEIDDVVYHIESVTHSCAVGMNGQKQFLTNLSLTHGIRSDTNPAAQAQVPQQKQIILDSKLLYGPQQPLLVSDDTRSLNPDLYIYSGITQKDNSTYEPGTTSDSEDL